MRILAVMFRGGAGRACGGEEGRGPAAGGGTGVLGKTVAAILAAGGSGLALSTFASSSFPDSASERSDPKHRILFREPKQEKKSKFLFRGHFFFLISSFILSCTIS